MRRFLIAALVCVLIAPVASDAQGVQPQGYAVAGLSGFSGFFGSSVQGFSVAGGGEVLAHGVGVSGELGLLGNASSVLSILSVGGVAHILDASRVGPSPFVTAGFTRMGSGEGSFNAWNIGIGVDVWANEHVGTRLEFRDHVRPDLRGRVQYWTVRVGVSVR